MASGDVQTISEVARRSIVDHLVVAKIDWAGRLDEAAFLSRLYDLTKIRSTDHRFKNAAGDIGQHRVSWRDWPDDWVFTDARFNLFYCEDDAFLRFLCETVHPVVRASAAEAAELVLIYNEALRPDGWKLAERASVSNRPVFHALRLDARIEVFDEPTGWAKVDRQLQDAKHRLETAQSEEHFQTVGLLCREALISVAQEVFEPTRHTSRDGTEVSQTDAKRMLDAFFDVELSGSSNEEARSHAKAALKLAVALQHRRTADFRMAALCCEATTSVINIVAILSGRRG